MQPSFDELCKLLREALLQCQLSAALVIKDAKETTDLNPDKANRSKMITNATLTFHHIENARMHLGKAIQAADGEISVYPR